MLTTVHVVHMDVCCLVYLDKSKEMWVALHLPACELKTVFFLPTVMKIGREALMELQTEKKRMTNDNVHQHYLHSISPAWVM